LQAELKKPDGLPVVSIDTEDEEITKLKHNLASIYTHFKIRRNYQSIYESTVDGIVHLLGGSIEKTGHEPTIDNIADEISKFFNIGKGRATLIAQRSMGALVASNYAIPKPKKINTFSFVEVDTSIHTDLLTLVKSIRDRSKLRYSREIRFSDAQVCEFILLALVIDGVRIAHSIITSYPMPDTSTEDIFKKSYSIIFKESPAASEHFINAAWSLFTHPDRKEAEILGSISKVAFLADLSLHEPDLTSLNIKKPFHRVALDASILLPAICKYHPRYNIYRSVISKAQKKGINVTVSEGFLEEIVTHRQLAKEIFNSEFYSNEQRFKNYVMFNGSDNINVFLGGFSGWSITEKSFDFQQYLKECAPYTDIDSLVNFLDRDRISRENPIKELSLETEKSLCGT
jgi:hypothetical protein